MQRFLAVVPERRVSEVMSQRSQLDDIGFDISGGRFEEIVSGVQLDCDGFGNLRHFKRDGQSAAKKIRIYPETLVSSLEGGEKLGSAKGVRDRVAKGSEKAPSAMS